MTNRKFLPFHALSSNHIVDLLAKQFDQGMLYSSLNVYHSAISSMHLPCEGRPVGKHPLVACIIGLHLLTVPCSLSIRGFGM